MKILFVCRGNVARSQMASELYNKLLGENLSDSVGTRVVNKEGQSVEGQKLKELSLAENVIDVMKEEGLDLSENKRTRIKEEMIDKYDKIIVMAEKDNWPEFLKNSDKVIYWEVMDPKNQDLEFHRKIKDEIKIRVEEFIKKIKVD